MSTIPASELVQVNPSVLGAAGTGVDIIGLFLTTSSRPPIGTVPSFPSSSSVADYFGGSSQEASIAGIYFQGFDNSSIKPDSILFAQYPESAVSAFLRGGDISDLTLSELQALSGSLVLTVDGYTFTVSSVSLAAATSFSSAASILQSAINAAQPSEATFTGSISGTTLTVTNVASGTIAAGQTVSGTGVTAGTIITTQLTGSVGGTGTYTVNTSQTALSASMSALGTDPVVTYDSTSGAFIITSGITGAPSTTAFATGTISAGTKLTSATGAVISQGAAASSPAAFMNSVIGVTQNWVTFTTLFDPDGGSGNTVKLAFASWKDLQNDRYAYIVWDTDASPAASAPATSSLGYLLDNNGDSGSFPIWAPDAATGAEMAAFVCGAAASIDFNETNGRITFAYKWQAGLSATVTTDTAAQNLIANGYNFGGAYGAANENFVFLQNGQCTGDFAWLDSYVNQIWLNNQFQITLLTLLNSARSIPYSVAGNSIIGQALADPIAAGLNFGAFGPGTISGTQIAEVNADAGTRISDVLQTQGSYLQILPATSAVRAVRGSPPCKFFYLDRGSVQKITLSSIAVP